MPFLKKITSFLGDSNDKALKEFDDRLLEIHNLEAEVSALSDEELRGMTDEFRDRLDDGETVDDILPEAFAVVREAAKRVLAMRHFDVQIIGGIVLFEGKVAEMRTGEGKTLVATLPSYLNALVGPVHVVTVNDYLAKRDAGWMGQVHHFLGLTVGCLQNQFSWRFEPDRDGREPDDDPFISATKQDAYAADIVYGTNNEFGFDYLRDNMVDKAESLVQRPLIYAIVDEVDNILIDEARTPLIISGPARDSSQEYLRFAQLARRLSDGEHFTIDDRSQAISLTEEGIELVERQLNIENLYDPSNYELTHFVENAVRAEFVYLRDKQYVVQDREVLIVDENTGRLMVGRRYSDGLHQAIEAKESVRVQRESITYATITLQNYFRMYGKLAGMTGTAATEAEELHKIYGLDVVAIPTNKESMRLDQPDFVYKTEDGKMRAVVEEIEQESKNGRPILVGTTSVERSEALTDMLKRRGVQIEVLNAKNHAREAMIIAQAGRPGAVTVSTNMAGRGTDIILGGNADQLSIADEEWRRDHDRVIELGGLYVIGTSRHESRRIDNQLRGRAGRQGDPGETRFFTSTEDDMVKRFGGDRIKGIMNLVGLDDDVPIENRMITKAMSGAQSKVEGYHFEVRKNLVDYDDVVNSQRNEIYSMRRSALEGEGLKEDILIRVANEVQAIIAGLPGDSADWDVDVLSGELRGMFELPVELSDPEDFFDFDPEEIENVLLNHIGSLWDARVETLGYEVTTKLGQAVVLRAVDSQWVEHLTEMDNMRQGIGLQAVGQRDPLVEYRQRSYQMFQSLIAGIDRQITHTFFNAVVQETPAVQPVARGKLTLSGPDADAPSDASAPVATSRAGRAASAVLDRRSVMSPVNTGHGEDAAMSRKIGRNETCPCGSGKKYKRCHGRAA
ncbi:MAG: preprotein translocase subunit SecA [Dehalococcoidia bacterium]|jgi:preprotein translocase subunit SecA|nr:preprotein translocase subunit SecA [Dehalococcoidia bacterium]MDP7212699.1 preprotein translocase subunit SecA [Dehalococcoidia bacterium]MDP7514904.1 preprotein translocase subunit SecA [Dehalococcoidia bacterium]